MFIDYNCTRIFEKSPKTKHFPFKVLINDSKFTQSIIIDEPRIRYLLSYEFPIIAIIKIYEERNLNVAKNLFLLMRYLEKKHYISISSLISGLLLDPYVPEYIKYHQEVQKFLLFS